MHKAGVLAQNSMPFIDLRSNCSLDVLDLLWETVLWHPTALSQLQVCGMLIAVIRNSHSCVLQHAQTYDVDFTQTSKLIACGQMLQNPSPVI